MGTHFVMALKTAILKVNIHIIYTNLLNQRWSGKWPWIRKKKHLKDKSQNITINNQQNVSSHYEQLICECHHQ